MGYERQYNLKILSNLSKYCFKTFSSQIRKMNLHKNSQINENTIQSNSNFYYNLTQYEVQYLSIFNLKKIKDLSYPCCNYQCYKRDKCYIYGAISFTKLVSCKLNDADLLVSIRARYPKNIKVRKY